MVNTCSPLCNYMKCFIQRKQMLQSDPSQYSPKLVILQLPSTYLRNIMKDGKLSTFLSFSLENQLGHSVNKYFVHCQEKPLKMWYRNWMSFPEHHGE